MDSSPSSLKGAALRRLPILGMMVALLAIALWYSPDRFRPGDKSGAAAADTWSPVRLAMMRPRDPFATGSDAHGIPAKFVHGLVALADHVMARRVGVQPARQAKIARIDADLDRRARKEMQQIIAEWERAGGYHTTPLPDFRSPGSSAARHMAELERAAEERIAALLSEQEKARWISMRRPGPSPMMKRMMPIPVTVALR